MRGKGGAARVARPAGAGHRRSRRAGALLRSGSKVRTTLTIDEEVLRAVKRAVKVRAARAGKRDSDVIEEALHRELGLELLDALWERADLSEDEALALMVEAQHETRRR